MKFKDKVFPYPVIKYYEDDYNTNTFNVDVDYKSANNELEITFNVRLTDKNLLSLLEQNKISFLIHLEESRTMYRKSYRFNEFTKTVILPLDSVKNNVEVVSFLVTNTKIENYHSNDFSDWFKGTNYNFDENLIVGFGNLFDINVIKEDDEFKSISSIFIVSDSPEIKDVFEIDYGESVISINVNSKTYETYYTLLKTYQMNKSKSNKVLLTIMVLPAFVEILNTLKEGYSNFENNLWYKSLVQAFKKKNIDLIEEFKKDTFEGYKYAQIIFDDVITESINILKDISEQVDSYES